MSSPDVIPQKLSCRGAHTQDLEFGSLPIAPSIFSERHAQRQRQRQRQREKERDEVSEILPSIFSERHAQREREREREKEREGVSEILPSIFWFLRYYLIW